MIKKGSKQKKPGGRKETPEHLKLRHEIKTRLTDAEIVDFLEKIGEEKISSVLRKIIVHDFLGEKNTVASSRNSAVSDSLDLREIKIFLNRSGNIINQLTKRVNAGATSKRVYDNLHKELNLLRKAIEILYTKL